MRHKRVQNHAAEADEYAWQVAHCGVKDEGSRGGGGEAGGGEGEAAARGGGGQTVVGRLGACVVWRRVVIWSESCSLVYSPTLLPTLLILPP